MTAEETASGIAHCFSGGTGTRPAPTVATVVQGMSPHDKELLQHSLQLTTINLTSATYGHRQEELLLLLLDAALSLGSLSEDPSIAQMPALLVEVAAEALPVLKVEGIVNWLHGKVEILRAPPYAERAKFPLLRACNMLLRRLSKGANAPLCGQVLMFLAHLLPLIERSGVNLKGEVNAANVTLLEEPAEGALDAEGNTIDWDFYKTFWGLQVHFSDPMSVLQSASKWNDFSKSLLRTLEQFEKIGVTVTEASHDTTGLGVKYLTSARLLSLQLKDATFRRHILVQALILLHFLEKPYLKAPTATSPQSTQDTTKSIGLKGRRLEDVKELQSAVVAQLMATPENGKEFTEGIRHLLQSEDAWASWKQAGCPPEPLDRKPASKPEGLYAVEVGPPYKRRKASAQAYFGIRVGTEELDRLWNLTEDNVSSLSAEDRGGFKTLAQLMDPVLEEMKEAAVGGELYDLSVSGSGVYAWKTLRFLARENLGVFAKTVKHGGDLRIAAKALYPDKCPTEKGLETQNDEVENPPTIEGGAGGPQEEGNEGGNAQNLTKSGGSQRMEEGN